MKKLMVYDFRIFQNFFIIHPSCDCNYYGSMNDINDIYKT